MYTYLILGTFAAIVFFSGYYFGRQMGRTEYIRQYLNEIHESRR